MSQSVEFPKAAPVKHASRAGRPWWRALMHEPVVHFVLIGLLLCLLSAAYRSRTDGRRVIITRAQVAQLVKIHTLQFGAPPTGATLDTLVKREIRDEVMYREGLALGLDKDDVMVRRRVIQKMEFFNEGLNPPAEPTEAQLAAYFRAHGERYAEPARVSFSHIFFSARDPQDARGRAGKVLAGLSNDVERAPERGDSFPDAYDYVDLDAEQLRRLFGPTAISSALLAAAPGTWQGPFQSAYGTHLVRLQSRTAPAPVTMALVRERVREDYLQEAQSRANRAALLRLMARYTIVREEETR